MTGDRIACGYMHQYVHSTKEILRNIKNSEVFASEFLKYIDDRFLLVVNDCMDIIEIIDRLQRVNLSKHKMLNE